MSGDFDFEPVRGLPERLPKGERLLWQGAPAFAALAVRGFHIRKVGIYFAVLVVWRILNALHDGAAWPAALQSATLLAGMGIAAVAILSVLALLVARTTVYSITSRRVVMRIGVALPITFNLPFTVLASAALQRRSDATGTGTVSLTLTEPNRLSYLIMWPHVRPWRFARPEPALRLVAGADDVARLLAQAVAAAAPQADTVRLGVGCDDKVAGPSGAAPWPLAPAAV